MILNSFKRSQELGSDVDYLEYGDLHDAGKEAKKCIDNLGI